MRKELEKGPKGRDEVQVAKILKASIAAPQHSRKQLLQKVARSPAFEVRTEVLLDWLQYLELMHFPELYAPGCAVIRSACLTRGYDDLYSRTPTDSLRNDLIRKPRLGTIQFASPSGYERLIPHVRHEQEEAIPCRTQLAECDH